MILTNMRWRKLIYMLPPLLLACATPKELRTDNIPVVTPFALEKYLGKWYEIARLPNKFEEGLEKVTANYSLGDDGEIQVINRGFNVEENEWEEAQGRAWIPDTSVQAHLRVSFFWIFASDYKIIALDQENYSYAMVTSTSINYLWILSREPVLEDKIYQELINKASNLGFYTSKLHKVKHD
jgi:apolipoprotein D and lipocalin family protein